jgi:hypothetical protein
MVSAIDKSVRDFSNKAIIKDGKITVEQRCGGEKVGTYTFPLEEWERTYKDYNPNWAHKKLIEEKAGMEPAEESGGPCQWDRIIDSQIYAIKKAYKLL